MLSYAAISDGVTISVFVSKFIDGAIEVSLTTSGLKVYIPQRLNAACIFTGESVAAYTLLAFFLTLCRVTALLPDSLRY